MAIESLQKITVIAHKTLQDSVTEELTRLSTVHVHTVEENEFVAPKELSEEETLEARRHVYGLSQIEFVLGFFKQYAGVRRGFLKTMIKDKYTMTIDEFMHADRHINLELIYSECSELDRRLVAFREQKTSLEAERDELVYWTDLEIDLSDLVRHHAYGVMPVRVPSGRLADLVADLESEVPESSFDVVSTIGSRLNCLIVYSPGFDDALASLLSRHKCEPVTLPQVDYEPAERLEQVLRELTAIERRREEILRRVRKSAEIKPKLEVVREYLENRNRQIQVRNSYGETRETVAIEGWLREASAPETVERLRELSEDLDVEVTQPDGDDHPPIALANRPGLRPFELLVKMYGSPNRLEYDPTAVVAVSFALFFGFCIGDTGYGVFLIVAFALLKRLLPIGRKARDLLTALMYGSAAAIVFGVLTGSYFGIKTDQLPKVLQSAAVLNPLDNTLLVMGVCVGIGMVHMLIGTGFEFRENWRSGHRADALIDQGLVFLLFVGGGITAALVFLKVVPQEVLFVVGGIAIIGMLVLLGRSAKSAAGKAVNGLYETYGTVVGYVSDSISYVRLFALGLATYIIALVINTMSGLVRGIGPVIGILLMLVVLLVGHVFNVAINLLGAFVHPLRLEFVEFFGKFYEDGGTEFKPLGIDSKIVFINDDESA